MGDEGNGLRQQYERDKGNGFVGAVEKRAEEARERFDWLHSNEGRTVKALEEIAYRVRLQAVSTSPPGSA